MARIKINMPDQFSFVTEIPIRITDLNYGGHVGNDTILSIIHEARVQFLKKFGYEEFNMAGVGIILSDVAIKFKDELFYGDIIKASLVAGEFSRIGFDIFYKFEKESNGVATLVVTAKTGVVCYNYELKKIVSLPAEAKNKLSS